MRWTRIEVVVIMDWLFLRNEEAAIASSGDRFRFCHAILYLWPTAPEHIRERIRALAERCSEGVETVSTSSCAPAYSLSDSQRPVSYSLK